MNAPLTTSSGAVFGYCEALLAWKDTGKIRSELQRITGLIQLVERHVGDTSWYFDDSVVPLYHELENWAQLDPATAQALLLQWFQDTDNSTYMLWFVRVCVNLQIYPIPGLLTLLFKALTCAYMRSESAHYQNFLPEPLQGYTDHMLVDDAEIDHIGFSALCTIFLEPAGIRLEIHQLNRYEHTTALDCEAFGPALEQALYTVRTLYRP